VIPASCAIANDASARVKEAFFAVVGLGGRVGQIDIAVEHPVKSPGDLIDVEYTHEISLP
jgi:hypothetical protein